MARNIAYDAHQARNKRIGENRKTAVWRGEKQAWQMKAKVAWRRRRNGIGGEWKKSAKLA